jgi:hypothetical protein
MNQPEERYASPPVVIEERVDAADSIGLGWDRFSVDNLLHQQGFPQADFRLKCGREDLLK